MSLVPAHHDDPDVKFNRPFLAGVLALCSEEAVISLSEIAPPPIPRSKSTQDPTDTKFTFALKHSHSNYCNKDNGRM